MIQLRNLEKSVASGAGRFFILRRLSLDIQQGEFVTIMGPSGAGKSTPCSSTTGWANTTFLTTPFIV
jgi:ABC-type lipoprotein export system ATPase subunit